MAFIAVCEIVVQVFPAVSENVTVGVVADRLSNPTSATINLPTGMAVADAGSTVIVVLLVLLVALAPAPEMNEVT